MGETPQAGRGSLERVREALNKVRRVLGDLDQSGHQRYDELRAHEAAWVLNIPLRDLYAAVREHRLPARRLGRFLWVRREDLDAFANELSRGHPTKRQTR